MKAKIIIREHNGYKEFLEAQKQGIKLKQYFGQFQYLFSTPKATLSIVQLWDIMFNEWYWEIGLYYKTVPKIQLTERFSSFEDAQKRAWEFIL